MVLIGVLTWVLCLFPGGPTYLFAFANCWLVPPAILLGLGAIWPKFNSRGAICGALSGMITMAVFTLLGDVFKVFAINKYIYLATLGFLVTLVVAVLASLTGKPKYYGRFNQGVVTLNLVDIACSSGGDEKRFWEIFDERLALCYRALMCRHNRLKGTPSDVAPILWQYGALARLKKGETIDKLLYGGYSTLSLGYAGLCECTRYMTGKSHTDPAATPFALHVMQHLNDTCKRWAEETNIAFSLYGTPLESTTYKFARCLQERFGVIEGVTDKNYITNSYHVHVTEPMNAFEKLSFEAQFQELSPAG